MNSNYNSLYNSRIYEVSSTNYLIENSLFVNISSNVQYGGGIYFKVTNGLFNCLYNTFYNVGAFVTNSRGGAIYCETKKPSTKFCCFTKCFSYQHGTAFYQISSNDQLSIINQSTFLSNGNSNCLGMVFDLRSSSLKYVESNSINCSFTIIPEGYCTLHYGSGPQSHTIFNQYISNIGKYIFCPYDTISTTSIHEFINFINNTATSTLIVYCSKNHLIKNSYFILNEGVICQVFPGYTSTISFQECYFDQLITGDYSSTINCNINIIELTPYFLNIFSTKFCEISLTQFSKKKSQHFFNYLFIFLEFFWI